MHWYQQVNSKSQPTLKVKSTLRIPFILLIFTLAYRI